MKAKSKTLTRKKEKAMNEENKTIRYDSSGIGNVVYIYENDGGSLIEVPLIESKELKMKKRNYTEPGEWEPRVFTHTLEFKLPRGLSRALKRAELQSERFSSQLSIAAQHPKHFHKISRCISYSDSVPRKYARIYPDFIRVMQRLKKTGFLKAPCLEGTVCRRNDE